MLPFFLIVFIYVFFITLCTLAVITFCKYVYKSTQQKIQSRLLPRIDGRKMNEK
jgi:hypothetical protein